MQPRYIDMKATKMNEIGKDLLKLASMKYKKLYGGAEYYDLATEIINKYPLQALIILLATWNTGRFRYLLSNNAENLKHLKKTLKECGEDFAKVKGKEFQTVDFDDIGSILKSIYSRLSKVKGVEYTGASKVMHLLNPELFLIWDIAMREAYGYEGKNPSDYLAYHKQVQKLVRKIDWKNETKPLPKAIDEYHYVTITDDQKIF